MHLQRQDNAAALNRVAPVLSPATRRHADELFRAHQQEIYQKTDRLFAGLMAFQWLAGIVAALWLSPRTWTGTTSAIHPHVWAAFILGGLISAFPIALALTRPGEPLTRYVIGVAQMLMSGLLIHLTGGRIETHFHIFGSLAFLAFYRDWRVLIPATIVTALDHFLRGMFWPQSVYGVLFASPWRSVEHAGWVIFEDVFLIISCLRSVREMRAIATHTAQLEITNQIIEEKVVQRTAEVKASEEKFRLLMDGVQDYAIIMLDTKGRVESWNEGAKRVHGYDAPEVLGQHVSIFQTNAGAASSTVGELPMAATGRREEEGWRVRKDGTIFWANIISTPLYDETGRLRGISQVTRDITQRKQAEEDLQKANENLGHANDELETRVEARTSELAQTNVALQCEIAERKETEMALQVAKAEAERANHAKSEFLSRMSHELRTPMNAILGFAQLLEMEAETPEQIEGVGQILKGGRHLLALINEVLDISRIEAGRLHLSTEPVSVQETLQESLALIQPLAQERSVLLRAVGSCDRYIMADRQRLKQVFLNLLSNAVKYNRQGGTVTATCSESPNGRLRVTIADTGLGIAMSDLAKLFTPFERLGATQSAIEGTGLGLALSKRLIAEMEGSMGAKSTVGRGSTFWLELPLAEDLVAKHERLGTIDLLPPESLTRGSQCLVLCIEDNLSNLRLIERLLQRQTDVTLMSAMQGSLGIELARQHCPDLILLDLHLPDMMGDEVLRRLKAEPETRDIPVVMISADATLGQNQRLRATGAADYLTKPLDVLQFDRMLKQHLAEHAALPKRSRLVDPEMLHEPIIEAPVLDTSTQETPHLDCQR